MAHAGETPTWGRGAVLRWVALLDRADELVHAVYLSDPHTGHSLYAQRQVSRAIDALFAYEHQMTSRARRQAREYLWRRDKPSEALPDASRRAEWEICRCRRCLVARVLGRPSIQAVLPTSSSFTTTAHKVRKEQIA